MDQDAATDARHGTVSGHRSYKTDFNAALAADPDRLHFSAHSHHHWPDVTRAAMLEYWQDSIARSDEKWGKVMGEVVPEAQRGIAKHLGLDSDADADRIALGQNTHEFLIRLLSCLPRDRPLRILSTDGEFHSFSRQMRRLQESGSAEVEAVPVEPFDTFTARFTEAASRGGHDLVFLSHVFFDSGYALDATSLARITQAVEAADLDHRTILCIDGYHAFHAIPVDLAPLRHRAFYMAGGYKYAMSGEALGFLYVPRNVPDPMDLRPEATGWFADFEAMERPQGERVGYGPGGQRFWGATFDPVGAYRFVAVQRWLETLGLDTTGIHAHVRRIQQAFLDGLDGHERRWNARSLIRRSDLVWAGDLNGHGHFLTFRREDAGRLKERLRAADVWTDHRADRLRFGFALYHDEADVERLFERLDRLVEADGRA